MLIFGYLVKEPVHDTVGGLGGQGPVEARLRAPHTVGSASWKYQPLFFVTFPKRGSKGVLKPIFEEKKTLGTSIRTF